VTGQRRTLRFALNDPGKFVKRRHDVGPEHDETEPLTDWQARAVTEYLREQAVQARVESRSWLQRGSSVLRKLADRIEERQA
jgi:hypothetical protein